MERNASEQLASPAAAAGAKRWRLAMPFALGLIVGAGIGTSALVLPRVDFPGEVLAALQEVRPAAALAAVAPAARSRSEEVSPRLAAPAPANETRRVWWKMPALSAAPFAVGSAR
jgi:hypothetical protein